MTKTCRLGWLAGSGLMVALAVVLTHPKVPLYDGVGFPDEAYRYVYPPANASRTPAPAPDTTLPPVSAGSNSQSIFINSVEQGPQLTVYLPEHSLSPVKPGLILKVTPKAAADEPSNGTIDGNVYTFATNQAGAEYHDRTNKGLILLRLPQESPTNNPTIVFRINSQPWQQLQTQKTGNDIYQAPFSGLGGYAIANVRTYAPVTINTSSAIPTTKLAAAPKYEPKKSAPILLITILVLVAVLLAVIYQVRHSNNSAKSKAKKES